MRKVLLSLAAFGVVMALNAAEYEYEFTPVVGGVWKEGNLNLEDELLVGGEFQFNKMDFFLKPELSLLYSPDVDYEPDIGDTDILRVMLNGVHEYQTESAVTPFTKVGIGYERIKDRAFDNVNSCFVDAGAGVKFPISDAVALKAEAIYMLKRNDNRWDSNLAGLVGLTFAFGSEEVVAAEPVEEVVAVVAAPVDSDHDGVEDAKDSCPNTPAGVAVDSSGCALDSDGDGVADYLDKCAQTPIEASVDSVGCPLDSDSDGVFDYEDKCPDTASGLSVDVNGCPESIILAINFANNSAAIDEAQSPKLQEYIDFMKRNSAYSVTIVGHTDSKGSASYNQKLSERRANAVRDRLIAGGVDAGRVSAKGMGEAEPIADNDTPEGMHQNRRIEAKLRLTQ